MSINKLFHRIVCDNYGKLLYYCSHFCCWQIWETLYVLFDKTFAQCTNTRSLSCPKSQQNDWAAEAQQKIPCPLISDSLTYRTMTCNPRESSSSPCSIITHRLETVWLCYIDDENEVNESMASDPYLHRMTKLDWNYQKFIYFWLLSQS